jgi:glycolate oxidase FAD binding subunit
LNWPDSDEWGPLGDGRFAYAAGLPPSIDDLRQTVAMCAGRGLAIYPQGGRTALDYGGTPRTPGAAIHTRGLNRVVDYPVADMTVTVEAGITLEALAGVLATENQRLLIDAPFPDRATLGGIFATNSCGPRRYGLGRPRDQILGVSFVTGDGALVKGGGRVVKNVAGYDFPRLLTGSMGTLGVITQMTLKVRPRPEASAIVCVSLPDLKPLADMLDRLNTSRTRPVAIEVVNPAAAQALEGPAGWGLLVGFEDNATSLAWQLDQFRSEIGHANAHQFEGADAAPVWEWLRDFQARELGPVTIVANLLPSAVASFLARFDSDRWAVQAHAGSGIVRAHALGEPEMEGLAKEIEILRTEAVRIGGNLTLSRCPADWKSRMRVWGEPRADWLVCEKIKQAFDPRGLMNPGRFVGTI